MLRLLPTQNVPAADSQRGAQRGDTHGGSPTPPPQLPRDQLPIRFEGLASPRLADSLSALLNRIARLRACLPAPLRARISQKRFAIAVLVLTYVLTMALVLPVVLHPQTQRSSGRPVGQRWAGGTRRGNSTRAQALKQQQQQTVWDGPTRAAEEEARRIAREEAPMRAQQEAKAAAREAARQRRIAERWANQTSKLERREQREEQRKHGRFAGSGSRLAGKSPSSAHDKGPSHGGRPAGSTGTLHADHPAEGEWPKLSPEEIEKGAQADELQLSQHARCLDGTRVRDRLLGDAGKRRQLVRSLAAESVAGSSRPLFLRMFLAHGLLDQVRFLWCASASALAKHSPGPPRPLLLYTHVHVHARTPL